MSWSRVGGGGCVPKYDSAENRDPLETGVVMMGKQHGLSCGACPGVYSNQVVKSKQAVSTLLLSLALIMCLTHPGQDVQPRVFS